MKLFIACSSREEIDKKYIEDCEELLEELFKKDNELVFGAYNKGLMNSSYQKALKYKRNIIGITPKIFSKDLQEIKCNKEVITENISRRTEKLIEESDALIFLPGGIGTIYELLTAIESKRSKEFNKPIIIYNSNNYFDNLLEFIDNMYKEKFIDLNVKECYHIFENINDLLEHINNY